MPGLRLTAAQVQRFCGIEAALCRTILDALVEDGFLELRPDATYVRAGDDRKLRPARAALRDQARARVS